MGNQNSGRRPQPTALTVLRGNPSRKKLNTNEVRPPAGDVDKPAGLSTGAGVVWDEIAPQAIAMGTLTVVDVRAFMKLCELEATFAANVTMKGTAAFDVRLERDTANGLRPYYDAFGLTPSSRARIVVPKTKTEEPVSKWAGVLT